MANHENDSKTGSTEADNSNSSSPAQGGHGYLGDEVAGLVPPSRLNEGDTGAASDKPEAGGQLDFDDGEMYGDRGKNVRLGGTYAAQGADSAPLGPPAEILSTRQQPEDNSGDDEPA